MDMSRSDAIAVHGMGQKMFDTVDAIRESANFQEMSAVVRAMSEEKLDKSDKAYEAKFALQLRIRTFQQNHNI